MPYADKDRQREFQRKWCADRRAEYFAGKTCSAAGCSETANLHLHHTNPEEKVSHRIWSWSKERREAELAKCVPLCYGHHCRAHGKEPFGKIRS